MYLGRVILISLCATLAACSSSGGSSSPTYKTITCKAYAAKWSASDALTNGTLDIAGAYLDSTPIAPTNGASDVADFADQIAAACDTVTPDTPISHLRGRIVAVFLAKHPEDSAP